MSRIRSLRTRWQQVKLGLGWPRNDVIMHGRPLPLGYAKVTIDTIVKRRYHRTVELDILGQDGKKLLGENMGCIKENKNHRSTKLQ
jgi:hypothetical protein